MKGESQHALAALTLARLECNWLCKPGQVPLPLCTSASLAPLPRVTEQEAFEPRAWSQEVCHSCRRGVVAGGQLGEGWAAETPTWVGVNPVGIQSIRGRLPGGLGGHRAVAVDAQGSRDGRDRRGSDGRRGAGSWEEKVTKTEQRSRHTQMQRASQQVHRQREGAGCSLTEPPPAPVASLPCPISTSPALPGPYLRTG